MSRRDVQWTLDELKSEREALEEALAEVRRRHAGSIAELTERLEREVADLLEEDQEPEEVEEKRRASPPDPEQPKKRRRRAARPVDPVAKANEAANERRRGAAKDVGVPVYESTDDEDCTVLRCVDCDKPKGSPPAGCGNVIAHRADRPGELPL